MTIKKFLIYLAAIMLIASCGNNRQGEEQWKLRTPDGSPALTLSIDSMNIANPFIYLDKKNLIYYMTGDGGHVWTSKNLRQWTGPYNVLQLNEEQWMGTSPIITAPEIHYHKGKYYYVATFTCEDVTIDKVDGKDIPRRSCQLLVADSIQGPYSPVISETPLLRADRACCGATFITDEYDTGFLIFSHDYIQSREGSTEIIMLTKDLSQQIGEPYIMFSASENPWSGKSDINGKREWSPLMDGAFLFDTEGMELGIFFTTEIGGATALGVAYTEKNHGLNGPWHIEPEPMLTGGYGQAMLFNDFDGSLVMVLHKEINTDGKIRYIPQLIEMDSQFDKLKIKGKYIY